MNYPEYAKELLQLLRIDQDEIRKAGQTFFYENDEVDQSVRADLKAKVRHRTERMLQILDDIDEPSISNVGADAAQAISVLATHASLNVLKRVLATFVALYERSKKDTYYKAIPAMTDWVLILEGRPQRFGTQWMFDANKQPFLPTVENFESVNERRAEYDVEPLHWPKSLAIPESEQPWLKKPLSDLIMRTPTDKELRSYRNR